jgi:Tfp pilus assembly protein PilN
LEAYQGEDIEKKPNRLILTGAVHESKDLETILYDHLHLPVSVMSYWRDLPLSDKAMEAASSAKHFSFLNAIVPLLAWQQIKVDLAPEEIKLRKSLEERGRDLIKTGVSILTIFVLLFSVLISKIYFKNAHLNALTAKYQLLNQETQNLEDDFTKISLIKNYLSNRFYSLGVLTELYDVAPVELELNDIRFDGQGKFSIKGTAESMSTVFSFVDSLEKTRYFQDVKTRYTTKRKDGSNDVTDFEIIALLSKEIDS